MSISSIAVVVATFLGPIAAVQTQKWIERRSEDRARKVQLFQTLMATRATRLAPEHVRALNMIDLTFYGRRSSGYSHRTKGAQRVLDAWKEYLDDLSTPQEGSPLSQEAEARIKATRDELFANILAAMAQDLGYAFDRVQLKKSAYLPNRHGEIEQQQATLLAAAADVFAGNSAIRVKTE